jgi:hypothetical protein
VSVRTRRNLFIQFALPHLAAKKAVRKSVVRSKAAPGGVTEVRSATTKAAKKKAFSASRFARIQVVS